MRDDNELMELVEMLLENKLYELWDVLEPEERRKVFPRLISEYVGSTF